VESGGGGGARRGEGPEGAGLGGLPRAARAGELEGPDGSPAGCAAAAAAAAGVDVDDAAPGAGLASAAAVEAGRACRPCLADSDLSTRALAAGVTTLRDVASWRVKETERMRALVAELGRLGVPCCEGPDLLSVRGVGGRFAVLADRAEPSPDDGAADAAAARAGGDGALVLLETYDDHRMAMALALAACGGRPVRIDDPGCTGKTFPSYWDVLEGVSTR